MMRNLVAALLFALSVSCASAQVLIPSSESQWNKTPLIPSGTDSLFMLQPESPGTLRYSLISFSQLATSGALTPNITQITANPMFPAGAPTFVPNAGQPIIDVGGFGPVGASPWIVGWLQFVDNKGVTRFIAYH